MVSHGYTVRLSQTTGGGGYMHYSNFIICIPQYLSDLLDFLIIHAWEKGMVPVWGREQLSGLSFLSTTWVQQAWWQVPLPAEQSHQRWYFPRFCTFVLVHSTSVLVGNVGCNALHSPLTVSTVLHLSKGFLSLFFSKSQHIPFVLVFPKYSIYPCSDV